MSFHMGSSQAPLAPKEYNKIVPSVIPNYDPKKQNASKDAAEFIRAKYKAEMNDIPAQQAAGSTLPLVEMPRDVEAEDYNPFDNRKVSHPTTDWETFVHLLKGSLGSGILAMPLAFKNAGLWFGLFATFIVGGICTYCVHILVKCSHILCRRRQIPSLGFADVAEIAFLDGPGNLKKWSRLVRFVVNAFLVVDLLGCCCVYVGFVATNLKEVVDHSLQVDFDLRLYMLTLLIPLIAINLIRKLKYLAPLSMIANALIAIAIIITLYYILIDLPPIDSVPAVTEVSKMPMFFGTVIFALEGIGVVMSLENNMKTPQHFIGCPGVLNFGMGFVVSLYACVGFLGYLKFGEGTHASVTVNLDKTQALAQSAMLMIAIAIFFTFALQFYVPMEIIWKNIEQYFKKQKNVGEYGLRVLLVCAVVGIAIAIPKLGPFINLIGAVCLSTLGLILPAVIELVVYWEEPGFGTLKWRLWKNCFLIMFGLIGFLTGTYVSILEITGKIEGGAH